MASGASRLADPRAAAEEAAVAALAACEGARIVLVFACAGWAEALPAVMAGVQGLTPPYTNVTGCAGGALAPAAGVVVWAIAGDDRLLRTGHLPRGPADAVRLAAEMGAPREGYAVVVFPGPEADATTLARAIGTATGLPTRAFPGALATADDLGTEPGGTLAWLLAGPWDDAVEWLAP